MKETERGHAVDDKSSAAVGKASGAVGAREVAYALEVLGRYRAGKSRLDHRVSEEAAWWQARHGAEEGAGLSQVGTPRDGRRVARPTSAWLFSAVCNKHADLCGAMPRCAVLPREPGDEAEAELLSAILPVIADRCRFEETYATNMWSKLKHGMAAYGVFWNPLLENGVGDIDIRRVDVRNLFWEPGVREVQESPHLFLVGLEDTEGLMVRYPQLRAARAGVGADGSLLTTDLDGSYLDQVSAGVGDKTAVIDWYYKRMTPEGRMVLHYAKIAGDVLLYASENDPEVGEAGWYDHGLYPFVMDVLYPEEGTPAGYGLIAVGRDPQGYIDELDGHILEYANHASRVRYWAKRSLGINEKDFLNPDRRIIEVEGDIDEEKLRQITLSPMDSMLCDVRRMKIDELKETTGNRDVSQGSTAGGVTAAAAITALQEAGNKGSRDMIAGSWRAYEAIMQQVIELIRQFYDGVRCFRITGGADERRYVRYSNTGLAERAVGVGGDGATLYRRPVFDIEVRAERADSLDRTGRNELMLELFHAGIFDPERAVAAERALSGMEFEGVEALRLSMRAASTEDGTGAV